MPSKGRFIGRQSFRPELLIVIGLSVMTGIFIFSTQAAKRPVSSLVGPVAFTSILQGSDSQFKAQAQATIKDMATLQSYLKQLSLGDLRANANKFQVNFSREMLILVAASPSVQNSDIGIDQITGDSTGLTVAVHKTTTCQAAPTAKSPYHFVKLQRSDQSIKFVSSTVTSDCSAASMSTGVLEGIATKAPTCSVQKLGQNCSVPLQTDFTATHPCQPAVAGGMSCMAIFTDHFQSDVSGRYSANLNPGHYTIGLTNPDRFSTQTYQATVTAGQTTHLDMAFDTGIR